MRVSAPASEIVSGPAAPGSASSSAAAAFTGRSSSISSHGRRLPVQAITRQRTSVARASLLVRLHHHRHGLELAVARQRDDEAERVDRPVRRRPLVGMIGHPPVGVERRLCGLDDDARAVLVVRVRIPARVHSHRETREPPLARNLYRRCSVTMPFAI